MNRLTTHNTRQTQKFAAQLAVQLLKPSAKGGSPPDGRAGASGGKSSKALPDGQAGNLKATVVGLVGDLGSGKTTFIQGFAKALGIKRHLTSPTFVIIRSHTLNATCPTVRREPYTLLHHIDTYRLKNQKELLSLGFKEILRDPKNIVLIEWADKIKKILPPNTIWINFEHGQSPKQRRIKIK